MQKPLVKVGSALFESTDTLLANRASPDKFPGAVRSENLAKYVTYNADALALLRHVHVEMSYHGRNIIKPNLNMEYSASCGSQVPINGFLFGDELQSQLNNIKASNKIGHTTTTKPSYRHHGDSWKGKASHQSGKPFLGNRGRSYRSLTQRQLQTDGLGEEAQPVTTLDTSTKFYQVNKLQYFKSKVDCFKAGRLKE